MTDIDPNRHELSTGEIDSVDEVDEENQLALVWCNSHEKYEWHNLPQKLIGKTGTLVRITRPGWKGTI